MGFLIDSNVLIEAERGRFDVDAFIQPFTDDTFWLAAITASELLHGIYRAKDPRVSSRRASFVEYMLNAFPVIPFDLEVARTHAQIWAHLEKRGTMIGVHDLQIAATARTFGHGVITFNTSEFTRIPELDVLNPLA